MGLQAQQKLEIVRLVLSNGYDLTAANELPETSIAKRSNYLISNAILQIPDFMLHVGRPAKPWSQAPACDREAAERKEGSRDERRAPGQ